MITAFVEMVAAGVKKLGLSPPLTPVEFDELFMAAEKIAESHEVHLYIEKDFLTTDLFDPELTRGKYVLFTYRDSNVIEEYMGLKAEKKSLIRAGQFSGEQRKSVARKFGRLLSYHEDRIERMLSEGGVRPSVIE